MRYLLHTIVFYLNTRQIREATEVWSQEHVCPLHLRSVTADSFGSVSCRQCQLPCAYGGTSFVCKTNTPVALRKDTRTNSWWFMSIDTTESITRWRRDTPSVHVFSHQHVFASTGTFPGEVIERTRTRPTPEAFCRPDALGKIHRSPVVIACERICKRRENYNTFINDNKQIIRALKRTAVP